MLNSVFALVAMQVSPIVESPSKIIFYRPQAILGAAIGCPIRYKGAEIVELGRGKYAEWVVPPGRYILTNRTASVEVTVSSGETRFVRCQIKTGFMAGRADLQIVDEESFNEKRANFEKKEVRSPSELIVPTTPAN